jgi:hypothetical protein
MRIAAALALSAALAAVATPSYAQTLAEIAKQEQERRKEDKRASKVYTNKDLQPVEAAPPAPQPSAPGSAEPDAKSPASGASAKGAEKPVATPAQPVSKDQAYWRKRMADAREQLDRDRTLAEALQTRINSLTTDFVNRDDPAQQAQLASDRSKALNELARLKKAVEVDAKAIAALEEEARRAGVPPGWLR